MSFRCDFVRCSRLIMSSIPYYVSCQAETDTNRRQDSFQGHHAGFKPSYFVKRFAKYGRGSSSCCIASLIYLERFRWRCPCVDFNTTTFQRLLLVATMTANKYLEDETFSHNRTWLATDRIRTPKSHIPLRVVIHEHLCDL
jgi:hypothetical protein